MKQQQGAYPVQRASRQNPPANPHYSGHSAGIHPENQPFISGDLEEDDSYYETRRPTSSRRYVTTEGNPVIQRGNKRIVIHNEPPPRKFHWSFILGLGMILALVLWVAASYLLTWWTNHQLDSLYGMPRTYQTDQVVGHADSISHPTHFIFINLNGHVDIIELPGGDATHAKIYSGPTLYSPDANQTPVTADFEDVNGDSKVDMVVHIGDQRIIYVNDGTQFKPQQ
jgi:hypothetical protein